MDKTVEVRWYVIKMCASDGAVPGITLYGCFANIFIELSEVSRCFCCLTLADASVGEMGISDGIVTFLPIVSASDADDRHPLAK